jgi:hypothetical protein
MKLQPQARTRPADINAVPIPRQPRSLRVIDPADAASAPRSATAPPAAHGAVWPLLALLLLPLALVSWWLLSAHDAARGVLLGAGALATLLPTALYYARRARSAASAAAAARRQLATVLGGVSEGVFLIGRDLRLSATGSASFAQLLRLTAPAGRRLDEVLRPLLDENALRATLSYLQRLWDGPAMAPGAETLNPLRQVEVSFANAHGASERRYLSFAWQRVAGECADEAILGVVADVTDRVLLARELAQVKADGDSQAGLLLQLVRADPVALVAFLDDADTALRKSNALLTAPGSAQPQLQKKLHGVLRELQPVTVEAGLLPLAGFAQRLRGIDGLLCELCARPALSGNDFLPVVVMLDELMSHATTMRSIHQHIVLLRAASSALAALNERSSPIIRGPGVPELP